MAQELPESFVEPSLISPIQLSLPLAFTEGQIYISLIGFPAFSDTPPIFSQTGISINEILAHFTPLVICFSEDPL